MNRINARFSQLKKNNKKAFIVFITAGYPNLEVTYRLILEFSKIGVDVVELGVPFSDPIADGPVIQEASQAALKQEVNLKKILNLVARARRHSDIPVCLMTYYNPLYCFGEKNFVREASRSGVDGVIIPDLPPEEGNSLIKLARKYNLSSIFFVSPTTSLKRMRFIARVSTGFIYYVSLTGVTGERKQLPSGLIKNIQLLKKNTTKPVCVGFGLSNKVQVDKIYKFADGVIIGSAVIRKIKENLKNKDLVKNVAEFINKLKNV